MRAELKAKLEAGATLLTPNRRLALHLKREFDEAQFSAGRAVWPTADILPWTAWLERAYEDALHSRHAPQLPLLLSASQELALWESAIRDSEFSRTLLSPSSASSDCREAWRLVHAWRLRSRLDSAEVNEDARAFVDWAGRYERACSKGRYTDASRLADVVAPLLASPAIGKPGVLLTFGFDVATLQQRDCLAALAATGVAIEQVEGEEQQSGAVRMGFVSARDELRACARWARARLEQNPAAHIGVVVPEFAQRRDLVRRQFSSVMQLDYALPGVGGDALPFNISLGVALSSYPLVHDALLLLELSGREIEFARVSRLVRSPFVEAAESELPARARVDAELRRRAPTSLSLDTLLRLMGAPNAPRAPILLQRLSQLADFRKAELFGVKLPSEWAKAMSQALSVAGFPGERGLDSAEYQTLKKWHEVVADFATLDRVAGRMGYAQACARLSRLAGDALFQPEAADVPIQILGVLESNHLQFDHLWVTGLTEDAWPIPLRPNPFVPIRLQREAGIPEADAAASLELDRRITNGWLAAAPEVVMSHPQREDDREILPSPLIAGLAGARLEDLALPGLITLRDAINLSASVESNEDAHAPALEISTVHDGGTMVFRDQAACPFRAFARHRLGAEGLENPQPGLDARDRGTLLHAVLAGAWKAIRSKRQLDAMADGEIDGLLQACAADAIARISRRRGEALPDRFAALEKSRLVALGKAWLAFERQRADFSVSRIEQ
jgi:ATP-dependent helicase/nuclease subunit B